MGRKKTFVHCTESLTKLIDRSFDAVNDSKVGPIFWLFDNGHVCRVEDIAEATKREYTDKQAKIGINQLALSTFFQILNCQLPHETITTVRDEDRGF